MRRAAESASEIRIGREGLFLDGGPPIARLAALENRIDADLALGRHAELIGELRQLVSSSPFRERFRGQLIVALYRAGRQADALAVY